MCDGGKANKSGGEFRELAWRTEEALSAGHFGGTEKECEQSDANSKPKPKPKNEIKSERKISQK